MITYALKSATKNCATPTSASSPAPKTSPAPRRWNAKSSVNRRRQMSPSSSRAYGGDTATAPSA